MTSGLLLTTPDVLVILAHHLYMKTKGLSQKVVLSIESCTSTHNVISVNGVISKHATIISNLLAAHALTGCDTVFSFAGIGKVTVLKKMEVFCQELKLGNMSASFEEIYDSCLHLLQLKYFSSKHFQEEDSWKEKRSPEVE